MFSPVIRPMEMLQDARTAGMTGCTAALEPTAGDRLWAVSVGVNLGGKRTFTAWEMKVRK